MSENKTTSDIENNKTEREWTSLFLIISIVLGGFVRLYPVLTANFPIHDGGLFYSMINDLIVNDFRLPEFTSYNQLNIPFVYPPLAFYISGALAEFTNVSVIDLVKYLPAIISTLTIPAFYFLGKTIHKIRSTAVLSTMAFAFLPSSFAWCILGGGITRSFAMLFFILAAAFTFRMFNNPSFNKTEFALSALFHLLIVLTHPEGALHSAGM
ncbi:MAG: hypothetical protein JEZ06_06350 [Anaerolineaceae bacterium]|nr:hypothetical protein [Anaerolineaceae bacterium]